MPARPSSDGHSPACNRPPAGRPRTHRPAPGEPHSDVAEMCGCRYTSQEGPGGQGRNQENQVNLLVQTRDQQHAQHSEVTPTFTRQDGAFGGTRARWPVPGRFDRQGRVTSANGRFSSAAIASPPGGTLDDRSARPELPPSRRHADAVDDVANDRLGRPELAGLEKRLT